MKNLLLLFAILVAGVAQAQDTILNKDGSELNVKIVEINDSDVKYQKSGLSISFTQDLSKVLVITFENGEKFIPQASSSKKSADSDVVMLTAGTRIPLTMVETISSDRKGGRKVRVGEVISLRVQADVTDIDGNILIKQGTLVNGTISKAKKRAAAGTKGKLGFSVDTVKAADGQSVPVSLNVDYAGKSKTAVAVGAAAVVALPLLLIKGKPAVFNAGQVFNALVVGDKKIRLNK